ncbi:MAG: hypothetical protein ACI9N9_002432 [Enterobacterales bacterium]|jgi:hypothetical protein
MSLKLEYVYDKLFSIYILGYMMNKITGLHAEDSSASINPGFLQFTSKDASSDRSNIYTTSKIQLQVNFYEDLDSLPSSYEQFFKDVERKDFFISKAWLQNIFDTALEDGTKPCFYGVEAIDYNSTPQALFAFTTAPQTGARINGWWVKGNAIAGTTNNLCYSHTFLYTDKTNNLSAAINALIAQLKEDKYPLIDLNLFAGESISLPLIRQAFNNTGMKASVYEYSSNWVENTEHLDYQQYFANRSKSTRKSILRQKRRLQEKHNVRFEILTQESDVGKAISLFNDVYAKSWKEPNYFQDFVPGLIRTCAKCGTLRFGVMYIDDKAVSVELCITANNKATFAKSAYDSNYAKHSPSSILLLHMIEHVISSDNTKLLSLGLFDDAYKKTWCQERRIVYGIVAFDPNTFWGAIGYTVYSLKKSKDNILQRVKPLLKAFYKSSLARF